jgi:hypothetical protein
MRQNKFWKNTPNSDSIDIINDQRFCIYSIIEEKSFFCIIFSPNVITGIDGKLYSFVKESKNYSKKIKINWLEVKCFLDHKL